MNKILFTTGHFCICFKVYVDIFPVDFVLQMNKVEKLTRQKLIPYRNLCFISIWVPAMFQATWSTCYRGGDTLLQDDPPVSVLLLCYCKALWTGQLFSNSSLLLTAMVATESKMKVPGTLSGAQMVPFPEPSHGTNEKSPWSLFIIIIINKNKIGLYILIFPLPLQWLHFPSFTRSVKFSSRICFFSFLGYPLLEASLLLPRFSPAALQACSQAQHHPGTCLQSHLGDHFFTCVEYHAS